MANELKYREILYRDVQLGPYPLEKLHRVAQPTNAYVGSVARRDPREHALAVSVRGDYGEAVKQRAPFLNSTEPLNAAFAEVQRHINLIGKNPVAEQPAPIPDDPRVLSRHIKSLAYFLGADMAGICRVPESAVYANDMQGRPIQANFRYAIVVLCRKAAKTVEASSGYDWIFGAVSFQAYQRIACQTETMANYIRRLGHEAEASNLWNYLTLMPQLIIEAGLGEVGRMGIAVNPFVGGNFKAAAVLTNLPLEPDQPIDFGLQQYCQECKMCSEQCPSKAIPEGNKTVYNGYETWKLDERSCTSFAMLNNKGRICGRCTALCPWNRPDVSPEHYAGWDGDMAKIVAEVNARARQLEQQDYRRDTEQTDKWWFDLEERDGKLIIPSTSERRDPS